MWILIIDDDEVLARSVGRSLRGYDVVLERDPARALARLAAGDRFDLVLCDLMMPAMSGVEVLDAIRAASDADAPTLVLMTGSDDDSPASADAVLRKPFRLAELHAIVAMAFENNARRSRSTTHRLPVLTLIA